MKKKIIVLKIKKGKTRFYECSRADIFNKDEMAEFVDVLASAAYLGFDVKVELKKRRNKEN